MRTTSKRLMILLFLVLVCSVSSVWATWTAPAWMSRPGTIKDALAKNDGETVYLDAVIVDKIKSSQHPPYFVIKECWDAESRIIVFAKAPETLRMGQTVDIEGVMGRLTNGERAILNPRLIGYYDRDSKLLLRGPLTKGILRPTNWEYKAELQVTIAADADSYIDISSLTKESAFLDGFDPPSGEPSSLSLDPPIYCSTIADAKSQADGTAIKLECLPINSVGSGSFTLGEDGSSDTLLTYYTGTVNSTQRINRISGVIQHGTGDERWLEVNAGPEYNEQESYTGFVQAANSGTIAYAWTLQDAETVTLTGKVVMADRSDLINNILYVEEPDRSTGIRVIYTGTVNAVRNTTITVTGSISTLPSGERVIDAGTSGVQIVTSEPIPTVLGLPNRNLGGGDFNYLTFGTNSPVGYGLYNQGLLLKSWGRVTAVDTLNDYFYIDDGSGLLDGSGNTGTKITWDMQAVSGINPEIVPPSQNWFVTVTGISSSETPDSGTTRIRVLRPRTIDDILVLQPEDDTAPTPGSASSPAATKDSLIQVTYTGASDTGGTALKKVELWTKKESGGAWTPSGLMSTGTSGAFSYTPSSEGTYYFDLVAEDYARNRSSDASGSGKTSTIYDITAPTGTFSVNSGATYINTTNASLTLSGDDALSGIYQMRLSNNGTSWNSWESFNTSKSWTLATGDGSKTVYVQFKDNAGNASGSFTDTIDLYPLFRTLSYAAFGMIALAANCTGDRYPSAECNRTLL